MWTVSLYTLTLVLNLWMHISYSVTKWAESVCWSVHLQCGCGFMGASHWTSRGLHHSRISSVDIPSKGHLVIIIHVTRTHCFIVQFIVCFTSAITQFALSYCRCGKLMMHVPFSQCLLAPHLLPIMVILTVDHSISPPQPQRTPESALNQAVAILDYSVLLPPSATHCERALLL